MLVLDFILRFSLCTSLRRDFQAEKLGQFQIFHYSLGFQSWAACGPVSENSFMHYAQFSSYFSGNMSFIPVTGSRLEEVLILITLLSVLSSILPSTKESWSMISGFLQLISEYLLICVINLLIINY